MNVALAQLSDTIIQKALKNKFLINMPIRKVNGIVNIVTVQKRDKLNTSEFLKQCMKLGALRIDPSYIYNEIISSFIIIPNRTTRIYNFFFYKYYLIFLFICRYFIISLVSTK